MIQRIQSVYLLLAAVSLIAAMCLPLASLYTNGILSGSAYCLGCGQGVSVLSIISFIVFGLTAAITLINIFVFKNRKMQMKLCTFSIILTILAAAVLGYAIYMVGSEVRPTIYASLPLISIVFNALASAAIRKDERLVRSADRLR
ncbi:MAG: DUF4293 domain-containing protein [Prevotellaceae bacterium]|nr:DUF4293 domain-containing protein [Prevotellaceae bacterium]